MSWLYALSYQMLDGQWHVDDMERADFVTMCGKDYALGAKTAVAPGEPACPACQHELVRKMLKNGMPRVNEKL